MEYVSPAVWSPPVHGPQYPFGNQTLSFAQEGFVMSALLILWNTTDCAFFLCIKEYLHFVILHGFSVSQSNVKPFQSKFYKTQNIFLCFFEHLLKYKFYLRYRLSKFKQKCFVICHTFFLCCLFVFLSAYLLVWW